MLNFEVCDLVNRIREMQSKIPIKETEFKPIGKKFVPWSKVQAQLEHKHIRKPDSSLPIVSITTNDLIKTSDDLDIRKTT